MTAYAVAEVFLIVVAFPALLLGLLRRRSTSLAVEAAIAGGMALLPALLAAPVGVMGWAFLLGATDPSSGAPMDPRLGGGWTSPSTAILGTVWLVAWGGCLLYRQRYAPDNREIEPLRRLPRDDAEPEEGDPGRNEPRA